MLLTKRIETANKTLTALHVKRESAMLNELKANPYMSISGLARLFDCSKSVADRVHKKHFATLPKVTAAKGWGY